MTSWTASCQASLSFTISQSLLIFMFTESVMLSNHLILCCRLLLLPSIFPSIRVFSKESDLHIRWITFWNFSFSPSNEYSMLISFTIDWLNPLAVLRSSQVSSPAPQLESINSLVLSLLYDPTLTFVGLLEKPIALNIGTFVSKVVSLFFNMLSGFVIAFSFERSSVF